MSKFYTIAAMLALFGTPVLADDFDATTYTLSATSGALDFNVDADDSGITDISAGVSGLEHSLWAMQAGVRGELSYNLDSDGVGLRGEYNVSYVNLYGTAAVEYSTSDASLKGGDWMFEPTVGISYDFTDRISTYAEASYAWDMSNSWDSLGGTVEIGMPIAVTNTVTLTPSLSRGFSGASEDWNANIAAGIQF
jgi:hypothetical protein